MKFRTHSFALAIFASFAIQAAQPAAAIAQQAATDRTPTAKAPFVFEVGDVPLDQLIQRCATYMQRSILFDDSELMRGRAGRARGRGAAPVQAGDPPNMPTVSLQQPVVTDRDGCEELLTGLLWSYGFALVPIDEPKGVFEVLFLMGDRAREIMVRATQITPEQAVARPTLRRFVTTVYKLQHTNATIATNALRPFFASSNAQNTPGLTLGNIGNAAAMILTGPQDQVANAIQVLQIADVPAPPEVVPDLAARLEALAKQNEVLLQRLAALEQKVAGTGR